MRRPLILTIAALATITLAGCSGGTPEATQAPTPTQEPTPTEVATTEPAPTTEAPTVPPALSDAEVEQRLQEIGRLTYSAGSYLDLANMVCGAFDAGWEEEGLTGYLSEMQQLFADDDADTLLNLLGMDGARVFVEWRCPQNLAQFDALRPPDSDETPRITDNQATRLLNAAFEEIDGADFAVVWADEQCMALAGAGGGDPGRHFSALLDEGFSPQNVEVAVMWRCPELLPDFDALKL